MLPCPFSSPILSTKFLRDIIREHVKNGQTKDKCSCKEGIGVKRDTFSSFHPIVGLLFFVLVLGFTMFFMHPVCLGISLVCALAYSARLEGGRTLVGQMRYMLPLLLFTALLNPLFNHRGATVLFQLPNGSSITLEAVAYGGAAAGMLLAVVVWFRCFGAVITSDKFLYLLGRISPSLSLLLSMAFRFVPRFRTHMQDVSRAQPDAGGAQKLRGVLLAFSATVTWALENAMETADSMKGRGYGLPGRTAFSVYRFTRRDGAALACLLATGAMVIAGSLLGGTQFQFYPTLSGPLTAPFSLGVFAAFSLLCLFPLLTDLWEDLKWSYFLSRT